jgi:LPS export ABC transporter permease LptG
VFSFPQIIDAYVLSRFLSYFFLLLAAFVLMTEVFTFFDLLSDIIRNKIPLSRVFTYLLFLTPKLIYDTAPVSVLVAVLVTFGVLTKHNEVIALKASGVSLYRVTTPVLLVSALFSAGLFAFDHFYVPEANRKQDALRDEIKGRPVQTYLRPDRKWIFGSGSRIYYYKHFDTEENVMVGVSVYELEPRTFQLRRHISAERAYWRPSLKTWIFENGWTRDIHGITERNFRNFQADTFPELDEPPDYFLKELVQAKQMNYRQLESYIDDLARSGFDTVRLRVQYHKKFSVPIFALIMAMLSVPFGFLVGTRGAMAGIGVSLGVAIAYWGVNRLFEQIGNVNQLPPAVAAWSPDALFSLAGLYLLLRMRS